MRSLRKNKQRLYYATYNESMTVYGRDESGEIVYMDVDGESVPVIIGETAGYNAPVEFYANIAMSGGEAESREYGYDIGAYEAVLVTTDMSLPITETSRIWHNNEPTYGADGNVDGDSATYTVLAVKKSLNSAKYLLKKLTKGN